MKTLRFIPSSVAIAAGVAMLLPSCATNRARNERNLAQLKQAEKKPESPLFEWLDDETTGSPSIRISLAEQKAYVYRGGKEVAWSMLATGKPGHRTPAGSYEILEKIPDKVSNLYGVIEDEDNHVVNWDAKAGVSAVPEGCRFVPAPMPHWMRVTDGGVGMHQGDIPDPGQTASHGCIRLPGEFATKLYNIVEVGTPVKISGRPPDYDKGNE